LSAEVRKKYLPLAEKIYRQSANSFLYKKIDKEKNWKNISRQIWFNSGLLKRTVNWSKYAAIFIVALLIGITAPKFFNHNSSASVNKIELEWGQMSKMTLSDGTQVWLNAGTTLEYPVTFDRKTRTVTLNGEGQFKVAHNPKIPFIVKTNSGVIKVHGTTFNVSAYDDDPDLTITLIDGKVSVENTSGNHLASLKPSDQLRLIKDSGRVTLKKVNTNCYSSWIEGRILLDEMKLSEISTLLKRWYNIDVQIIGEGIGDLRISGTISKGKPLDLFLKILERMYDVKYKLITNNNKKDEIIIYKNELRMDN
jgi:ferric-dicitrate binding protein FerR (iron transport regulator)